MINQKEMKLEMDNLSPVILGTIAFADLVNKFN
jgi:hypothetical protein